VLFPPPAQQLRMRGAPRREKLLSLSLPAPIN
jgi:hypothetical protein